MFPSRFGGTQPQRDMGWLHGFLYDLQQMLAQLA
jgi:hypothetical protein